MTERSREFRDRLVRVWKSTAAGFLPRWEWTDSNSFDLTFGGAPTNGPYVTTIDPKTLTVPSIVITTTRAGGLPATNTDLAAQHVLDIEAALLVVDLDPPAQLVSYLQSASSALGVVSVIAQPAALPFRVTTSAPGGATLDVDPDDEFPITFDSLGWGASSGARTAIELCFVPVDAARIPLDPSGATVDVTIRRMVSRGDITPTTLVPALPVGVCSSVTTATHPLYQSFRIDANGGRYGFSLGPVVGAIVGLDAVEVWCREVTE